ncbi:hypothetical protein E2P81_ATG10308 [Venturia nashicola]|nr:hypothetical protein E2P81_ATG10308 [Venturia nashicola]
MHPITSDHAAPRWPVAPSTHAGVIEEDTELLPRGLAVQKADHRSDREHSVLLPPPATLLTRPFENDTHASSRRRGYPETAVLATDTAMAQILTARSPAPVRASQTRTDRRGLLSLLMKPAAVRAIGRVRYACFPTLQGVRQLLMHGERRLVADNTFRRFRLLRMLQNALLDGQGSTTVEAEVERLWIVR